MLKATQQDSVATRRGGSFRAIKAVAWGFLGIRKRAGYESDIASLRPAQVIVTGVVCAATFVGTLIGVVRFVIA